MKKISTKTLVVFIASQLLLSSCSHTNKTAQNFEDLESHPTRELASQSDNCFEVARSLLMVEPRTGLLTEKEVIRKFTRQAGSTTEWRQKRLKLLEDKYRRVDSLLDFQSKAHIPINDMIKVVDRAEDGLLAKIMLIRKAKKSIDLTYFLFDDSLAPQALLHELRLAAKRGVKIRLMYDPVGSKMGTPTPRVGIPEDLKALADLKGRPILDESGNPTGRYANIEIVQFNPMWKPGKMVQKFYDSSMNLVRAEEDKRAVDSIAWNNRIHDKILLIDAEDPEQSYFMTGGRNLNDSYYHLNHSFADASTEPTTDIEVILRGSSYVGKEADGQTAVKNDVFDQFNRIFYAAANLNISNHVYQINDKILDELATDPAGVAAQLKQMRKKEIAELRRLRAANRQVLGFSYKDAEGNLVVNEGLFKKRLAEMEAEDFLTEGFERVEYTVIHEVHNLSGKPTLLKPMAIKGLINDNSIQTVVFDEMLKGKKRIDIVSPYFWIDTEQTMQLVEWLKADPNRKINVTSNSFLSTDNLISQVVVEDAFNTMQVLFKKHGVSAQTELRVIGKGDDELLQANGKEYGFLHAKVYMVDGKVSIVSTSNLDPISRLSNSEVGVRIVFPDENGKNAQKMQQFLEFVRGLTTDVNSDEYKQMLADPDAAAMLRKLKIYKAVAKKMGLLHLL